MFKWWRREEQSSQDVGEVRHSHSHSHSHSHELPKDLPALSKPVKVATFGLLAAVALATIVGLVALWPDADQVAKAAERSGSIGQAGTYEQGEVLDIQEGCVALGRSEGGNAPESPRDRCLTMMVGVHSGPDKGRTVDVPVRGALASAGLQVGDRLELIAYSVAPNPQQTADASKDQATQSYEVSETNYGVSGVFRGLPLLILGLLFAAVVIWVGRLRGALSLVALGISAFLLLAFILPALVSGQPGVPVALVGASAIMFVILYFVHGPNMRTTAALIGTLCGILIMALISLIAVHTTRLSGIGDESSGFLSAVASDIDFRGLLTCAIIIAGLGILNDVTITQSSAVWELRAAAPEMPRREIFARAMRIGRDHIASTVYTVFFSYVGAALSVLLLLYLYDRPVLSLLTREDIAVELVRTFCGSIGLILAVPITTWVATLFTPPGEEERHLPWGELVSDEAKTHHQE
ncbi:YibE/F family protein [Leucobacter viscericola]|uniref:YibE/F family protein n=1 Tax=Leucobacter viscericola TaxID=2714935 RepID=A0A6G7XDZ6_9MICO|nr:YibE/F family protein [Leucobacter viscericola]QIK62773.1 YibE/F family protein [Leucobacter viscericola]